MFEQRKILITGGAGFIGSQLGHHLESLGGSVALRDGLLPRYLMLLQGSVTAFRSFLT